MPGNPGSFFRDNENPVLLGYQLNIGVKMVSTEYEGSGERTADECDFAANIALAETANHLRRKQAEIANIVLDPDFDGVHCVECGQKILKERIAALLIDVIDDGKRRISSHPTDRRRTTGGVSFVRKHGSDKCVACQSEASRAQLVRGRQHAF